MENERKRNLLEVRNGLVHADGIRGNVYTLCGVGAENSFITLPKNYSREEDEFSTEPMLLYTDKKITCSDCISIIRHCCKLGLKSIGKEAEIYEEF